MPRNDSVVLIALDPPTQRESIAKNLAYGPSIVQNVNDTGGYFRNERGKSYYRAGKAVKAVPQFKGQKITIETPNAAALPVTTTVSGSQVITTVSYPTGPKTSTGNSKIQNVY